MQAARKHMLIVEDTESIALVLSACFAEDGFTVKIASTIKRAISCYRASLLSNSQFDVLLIDNCLPDGSGIEFLQEIDQPGKGPVKIMLSADGREKTKIRAIAAGAHQFLEKPINTLELRNNVAIHLKQSSIVFLKTNNSYEEAKEKLLKNYLLYLQTLSQKLLNPMPYRDLKCLLHQLKGSAALYDLFELSSSAKKLSQKLHDSDSKLTNSIRQELNGRIYDLLRSRPCTRS